MQGESKLSFAAVWLAVTLGQAAIADRPNIVFFFVDDLGWTDVGYMNNYLGRELQYYETPNIDRLAESGMIFTDAYANAPNCAPSRACLMSGQYPPRHGIFTVGDPRRGNHADRKLEPIANKTVLDDRFVTIAETLQSNGYETASMGKWHLGDDPCAQGFDLNIAGKSWGSPSGGGYHSPFNYPNLRVSGKGAYLTDVLTEKAVQFIEANESSPFFLYLTHYAVHTPIQAKESLTAKYRRKQPTRYHDNPAYAAMIESVDASVGTVLSTLEKLELADRTIVVFFSDNGGFMGATRNTPLRGAKGMLYEGGIREPLIIRWPNVTAPNSLCREPVIGIDFYPTLLEIAGARRPNDYTLDGESLVPLLRDPDAKLKRPAIFWHFPCYLQGRGDPGGGPFRTTPAGAVRKGDWKLIEWFETERVELYNLANDIGESNNLAQAEPKKLRELQQAIAQWRSQVAAPVPTTPNPRYNPSAKRRKKANRRP